MVLNQRQSERGPQPLTHRMSFPPDKPAPGLARLPPHSPRPSVVTTLAANETKPTPAPEPEPEESPPTMTRPSTRPPPPPAPEPSPAVEPESKRVRGKDIDKARKAAALAALATGERQKDVAARFGLKQSTLSHWLNRDGRRGGRKAAPSQAAAEPSSNKPLARLDAICTRLQASIEESTQALREVDELRTALRQLFGG